MKEQSSDNGGPGRQVDSSTRVEPIRANDEEQVPRSKHVFPYFLKQNAVTLFSVDERVNSEPLAMVLAMRASRPTSLPLFGAGAIMPTVICHGVNTGDERADSDAMWKALEKTEATDAAENGEEFFEVDDKLHKLHQTDSEWDVWHFDVKSDRERFIAQVPLGALIFVHDVSKWMSPNATKENYAELAAGLGEWCKNGHTVVIFETATDVESPSLKAALTADADLHEASWDEGAPHELGGGCIVTRKRKGYFDSGPTRFNFWFKVFRRELEWGLEMRADADPLGGKQLAIYQRRMLVDSMLKDGLQQKEIAVELGRNAATISRDVEALKKKLNGRK